MTLSYAATPLPGQTLRRRPWLDIDVVDCSERRVVLHCGIDLSLGPEVEITFDTIFLVSFLMSWKMNTSRPILEILSGDAAFEVNTQYQVEQGYYLLAFTPDVPEDVGRFIIAAHGISWRWVKIE